MPLLLGEPSSYSCVVCGGKEKDMYSLCAPGTVFMCEDCIPKEEERLGRIAILFYARGIEFLTPEEVAALPPNRDGDEDIDTDELEDWMGDVD